MTDAQKKEKILACIASRGWVFADLYWKQAQELKSAGLIKMDVRYVLGGNRRNVWIAA